MLGTTAAAGIEADRGAMASAEPKAVRAVGVSPWMVGWALAAGISIAGYGAVVLRGDFADPDNAMRLVEARDFLHGQNWYDLTQHRLDPAHGGTPMHWARWIDAAIGSIIRVFALLLGPRAAEVAAGFVWPLGLLALLCKLSTAVSARLGALTGDAIRARWVGAVLIAFASPALVKFAPGEFDHHNVETVLAFAAMLAAMRAATTSAAVWGVLAGAALAAMPATAAEGLPIAAAGLVAVGLGWLLDPVRGAKPLAWAGPGYAVVSLIMFVVSVPPERWGAPVCDAMGSAFLGFGMATGTVALVLANLPSAISADPKRRIAATAALCIVTAMALASLFPECRGGGYSALTADLKSLWLVQISEARSLFDLAADDPAYALALAGPVGAGLVAAFLLLRRASADQRIAVLAPALMLLASAGVMVWQIRGAYMASAFAAPFGAWAVARLHRDWRERRRGPLPFALAAAASAAAIWNMAGAQLQPLVTPTAVLSNYKDRVSASEDCASSAAIEALRTVRKGVVFGPFAIGAHILAETDHSVVAAPYHRDAGGLSSLIAAMRATPEQARAIVRSAEADYVLACASLPEMQFFAGHPADPKVAPHDTFAGRLAAGEAPAWLEPVTLPGATPLKLWRVRR